MSNKIPEINVIMEIMKILNTNPLVRDVCCLIGCFEDYETINEPVFCKTLQEAEKIFGDDAEIEANAALKQIFRKDISGCLIVNCTSTTGSGDNINVNRNLTEAKLRSAFDLIELISFNQLYVATELTDAFITKIEEFRAARFESKRPFGWIGVGTRNTEALYIATSEKLGDGCRAFLTQPLIVNGSELTLLESGAYITNVISTLNVGNSLTAKTLDEVTGLGTSYTFEDGSLGKSLVEHGFFVVRLIDALNNTYEVVNSANPNGLDLYIGRVTDYIVEDFALRQFLGEHNDVGMNAIEMECTELLKKFRNDLSLVKNINYEVVQEDTETVDVILNSIDFADVITTINLYITIKVV